MFLEGSMDWKDKSNLKKVAEGLSQGMSATQIAEILFKRKCTRNAVIGVCNRHGGAKKLCAEFGLAFSPEKEKQPKKRKVQEKLSQAKTKVKESKKVSATASTSSTFTCASEEDEESPFPVDLKFNKELFTSVPENGGILFKDRKDGQCSFVFSDEFDSVKHAGATRCCGNPTGSVRRSYCKDHRGSLHQVSRPRGTRRTENRITGGRSWFV